MHAICVGDADRGTKNEVCNWYTLNQCSMVDCLGKMMEPMVHFVTCNKINSLICIPHLSMINSILQSLPDCNSILRVMVAFSVGLDCPNIRRVNVWGLLSDINQGTGRAGCHGEVVMEKWTGYLVHYKYQIRSD